MLHDLGRLLQLATHSARTLCQDLEKLAVDHRECELQKKEGRWSWL